MSATTTQLLSSGQIYKLRYDTIPVKSASANVSFYTSDSKMPNFELWHCCRKWAIYCAVIVKAKYIREGQTLISVISSALVQVQLCLSQDLLSWGTADLGWGDGISVPPDRGAWEPELCVRCIGLTAGRGRPCVSSVSVVIGSAANQTACSTGSVFGFSGCETNKWPLSAVEIKNAWIYTPSSHAPSWQGRLHYTCNTAELHLSGSWLSG
jgi:hypothetical protein